MTQLIVIAAYLSLLLILGVFANRLFRGTSKDYLLASHSIGPFLLLMSIFGTTMTAFALVGSTGEAFKEGVGVYGQLASSSGIIHSVCFFLVGIRLWSFGRRHGYSTQIQFFRDRLESDAFGYLLFPILVSLVIPYLLIGVLAGGTVISSVSEGAFDNMFASSDYGVPRWIGSLVICCVVLIYVFYGGMRGTAWANTFQTLVFMVLGVVTFLIISDKLGGLQAASQRVLEQNPSKLMREVPPEQKERYERERRWWEAMAVYNWATRQGSLELTTEQIQQAKEEFKPRMPGWEGRALGMFAEKQGLIELDKQQRQRALLVQDDRVVPAGAELFDDQGKPLSLEQFPRSDEWEARALRIFADKIGHPDKLMDPQHPEKGKYWSRKKAVGIYRAANWAPEEVHSLGKLTFFTYLLVPFSVGMFPHLFQHWLTARSARTFRLPVVAHPIFIMIVWVPCVLVGVWATSAELNGRPLIPPHFPANAVLSKMVSDMSTPLLGGLLTAGILAAIMSSLDSQFLCLGTMFTTDIVVHRSAKGTYSDKQVVVMARLFIVAIVLVTFGFSLLEPRRVFTLGVWCFSGFSSLFPLVFAAVYWRRLTLAGAFASVLAAIGSWIYFFADSGFGANPRYTFDLHLGGEVYHMMAVAPMFLCSAAALLLVSLVTRPPSAETLSKYFRDK